MDKVQTTDSAFDFAADKLLSFDCQLLQFMLDPARADDAGSLFDGSFFVCFDDVPEVFVEQVSPVVEFFFGLFVRPQFWELFCELVEALDKVVQLFLFVVWL